MSNMCFFLPRYHVNLVKISENEIPLQYSIPKLKAISKSGNECKLCIYSLKEINIKIKAILKTKLKFENDSNICKQLCIKARERIHFFGK